MTNLQKRILTSAIILPLSIFFIFKGGWFLTFFLFFVLFVGLHEVYTSFKTKVSILFLSLVLSLAIASIFFLRNGEVKDHILLYVAMGICISSDIGGYAFGKIFKGKKLTLISPKKTISGVFGSYFFSLIFFITFVEYFKSVFNLSVPQAAYTKGVFLAVIFSTIAQFGDLIISYFKRIEKIKDTGKILPGHGGIFDRIDGLMFVVIFAYILTYFNPL